MQNILQLNGGVSVMPVHFKTRVFDVIPHSVNLGYIIHNYITYFMIVSFINPVNLQALAHWCVIYFTFLSQDEANRHYVTSDCYCFVLEVPCESSNH
jgi:hypothetical protein